MNNKKELATDPKETTYFRNETEKCALKCTPDGMSYIKEKGSKTLYETYTDHILVSLLIKNSHRITELEFKEY